MRIGNTDHVVVELDQLGEVVNSILKNYADEARIKIDDAVLEVSEEARLKIKENANVGVRKKNKYKNSFRKKVIDDAFGRSVIIHATNHNYSLTHLLENGHWLWNRPQQPTRAFPHWKKGEKLAIEELPKSIKRKLGG